MQNQRSNTPSLTERTLERLRAVALGNGMDPESIQLVDRNEASYSLNASIRLKPKVDVKSKSYAGRPKGKGVISMPTSAALNTEADNIRNGLANSDEWLKGVFKEIHSAPGHCWGLDGALVVIPKATITMAACETCVDCRGNRRLTCHQCLGKKQVVCSHCQGQGRESCYNCFGRGEDPVNPSQQCPTCRGTRFAICRYCQSSGYLICPTCQGNGGTPCPQCSGTGTITQEITLTCNAEIDFKLSTGVNIPSGVLKAMDRLGTAKIAKGHADIEMSLPDLAIPGVDKSLIGLVASFPYADIKLRIAERPLTVSAFGKRCVLFGVPPFLDEALKPWREELRQAAGTGETLDKSMGVRAIRDALETCLSSASPLDDFHRLYPVGMSREVIAEIIGNIRKSVQKLTLRTRTITAFALATLAAAISAGLFATPLHWKTTHEWPWPLTMAADLALPFAMAALGWMGLNRSVRWTLKRRYPNARIGARQRAGKTGYSMVAAIVVSYAALFAFSPFQPEWLIRVIAYVSGIASAF